MTENEEKKEYLKSYKKIRDKIKSLEEQLESVRISNQSAKVQTITDMPGGNKQTDLSDYMVKVDELERDIERTMQERMAKKLEIERRIMDMSDGLECLILRKRYIELKGWEQVCVEIDYSWKQTHRLHSRALINFELE